MGRRLQPSVSSKVCPLDPSAAERQPCFCYRNRSLSTLLHADRHMGSCGFLSIFKFSRRTHELLAYVGVVLDTTHYEGSLSVRLACRNLSDLGLSDNSDSRVWRSPKARCLIAGGYPGVQHCGLSQGSLVAFRVAPSCNSQGAPFMICITSLLVCDLKLPNFCLGPSQCRPFSQRWCQSAAHPFRNLASTLRFSARRASDPGVRQCMHSSVRLASDRWGARGFLAPVSRCWDAVTTLYAPRFT